MYKLGLKFDTQSFSVCQHIFRYHRTTIKESLVKARKGDCPPDLNYLFQSVESLMSSKQKMSGSNKSIKTSKAPCLSTHMALQMDFSLE